MTKQLMQKNKSTPKAPLPTNMSICSRIPAECSRRASETSWQDFPLPWKVSFLWTALLLPQVDNGKLHENQGRCPSRHLDKKV
ncbi:hypothetical protein LQZ18_11120 [Lachnospiraceae bacterium ZAX-1]